MNGIEAQLLDLVQIAESPLYSAYRWLGRQLGRGLSISEFLRLVDGLVQQDMLRLWSIDPTHQKRSRLSEVPEGLEQRYVRVDDLDESFDPFALSLTLGPEADLEAEPDWEVDFDFDRETFRVKARPGAEEVAVHKLARLFPDVELVEEQRGSRADRVEISGSLRVFGESGGFRV
jgi:hypothetical protein